MITRRDTLKNLALGSAAGIAAAGPLGGVLSRAAFAADRVLEVNIPGNSLGVHIPYMAAMNEILPSMEGYAKPDIQRVDSLRIITQSILGGQVDVGAGDAITTLRAVQAGADLKIVGHAFVHTSLVFVVNADKVKTFEDFLDPDTTFAVNSLGDFTYALAAGPLLERGIDPQDANFFEIGGSGARMRALLAGRVDGVPLHFDQAEDVKQQGNYKVMIEPAKEYEVFFGEVWIVGGEWLQQEQNQRAVVDLLKSTITAFRRTHDDPQWYYEMYRKYGTKSDMAEASDEQIEVVRQALGEDIGCWPRDMNFDMAAFEKLVPVYKQLDLLEGEIDLKQAVETRFVEQALDELAS